jgi:excisionase family DNA binding protein
MPTHSSPVVSFPEALMTGIEAQPVGFEPLLNVTDAARLLGGLHPKTLMRWARAGELPAFQIGRLWFFRASELNCWLLKSHKIRPANVPA